MRQHPLRQEGFGLVWALSVISLVFVLLTSSWLIVRLAIQRAEARVTNARLESLVESGLHFALAKLNQDANFGGVGMESWRIVVATPSVLPPRTSPDFSLHTRQLGDWRTLHVRALMGRKCSELQATVLATYHPRYPAGILALEGMTAEDIRTDSYDASKGNYRQTSEAGYGDIWSFGNLAMTLRASSSIQGTCNAKGEMQISGDALRIQSTSSLDVTYPLTSKLAPIDAIPITLVSGQTRRLTSGKYRIDLLNLTETTRLFCDGQVEIYTNEATIPANSLTSVKEDPWATKIFVRGQRVQLACPFTGIVDAPSAHVSLIGPGELFGAIVGRTVDVGPAVTVHFDRSLPYRSRGPRLGWELTGLTRFD